MKATIFNIQKFCLHDGPGIRTTVFFKGCNLKCRWCANPESQQLRPQLTLDRARCLGCGRCAQACPKGARQMMSSLPRTDMRKCQACGACMEVCSAIAIAMEGREVTVEEVLNEVMKDAPFYERSGGGVTFSGGEVLLQQDFAMELARKLHQQGVSVAVETAAAVSGERFKAFLREIDYIFVDLKHYDGEAHRAGTGIGNEQILENIRAVQHSGLPFTLRIPVIPGYNDAQKDARGFAQLLADLDINRVQLLPFHQLGERKYDLLGRDYAYAGAAQLHREDLQAYQNEFKRLGVQAEL